LLHREAKAEAKGWYNSVVARACFGPPGRER
jgi:hypothetical protein